GQRLQSEPNPTSDQWQRSTRSPSPAGSHRGCRRASLYEGRFQYFSSSGFKPVPPNAAQVYSLSAPGTENIRWLCAWKSWAGGLPKRGGNSIGLRVPPLLAQVNKVQSGFTLH